MNPETHHLPAVQEGRTTDTPTVKRGCSCWVILLCVSFLALSLLIVAYHAAEAYYDRRTRDLMTEDDQIAFSQWENQIVKVPPLSPATDRESRSRIRAKSQSIISAFRADSILQYNDPVGGVLYAKLTSGNPLTLEDLEGFTTATDHLTTHIQAAIAHVNDPEYTFNARPYPDPGQDGGLFRVHPYIIVRMYVQIYRHEWQEVPLLLDTLLKTSRFQGNAAWFNTSVSHGSYSRGLYAILLADTLSSGNLLLLTEILDVLNANQSLAVSLDNGDLLNGFLYRFIEEANADGFPARYQPHMTMRELYKSYHVQYRQYVNWFIRTHPPTDPRVVYLESQKDTWKSFSGSDWDTAIGKRIPPRWRWHIDYYWQNLKLTQNLYYEWDFRKSFPARYRSTLAQYQLTRLWLARRIAELRGDPLPATRSDFVPRYLPDWPADPFSPTADGFSFDATRGEFYSVGEDGTPTTADDVYLELPSPESLTSATQSLDKEPAP